MDIAKLSLEVDSSDMARASKENRRFEESAGRAERAGTKMGTSVSAAMKSAAAAAAAAAGAAVYLGNAINMQLKFGSALAETSTLLNGNAQEMAVVEQASRDLAKAYGGSATAQAQAFYQAISAGAESAAEASRVLDVANQLAIGGVTDVTTAVDILTTATNIYATEGLKAAEASDALFVAMKAGKTTVTELSTSLGKVLPLAENLGVSFDETAAATAALTKGGISTTEAVTGLRAAMTAVLGPSKEATDLAKELGIDFNAAAVEAMGFADFMADVTEKTGGSSEAMQTLFSSVEATTVALSLSGQAGQFLSSILADMEDKAGATGEAFRLLADDDAKRLDRAMSQMNDVMLSLGAAALTGLVPAVEATAGVLTAAAENADALAIAVGVLAATRIPAMIGAISTAVTWLGTLEAALIVGVIQARALAFALNAIPFAAVVTVLTGVYRGFRESGAAARAYASALDTAKSSQDELKEATKTFYTEVTQANLDAMRAAAENAVEMTRTALDTAKRELEAASFFTNFFGANLYETDRMASAQAAIERLTAKLAEAEARVSAAEHAQENFNDRLNEGANAAGGLSGEAEKLLANLNHQVEVQRAIAKFGEDSAQVAALQAEEERRNFAAKLESLDASKAAKRELMDTFLTLQSVTQEASATSANIGGAASEAGRLAQNLAMAANALSAVMNATANMNISAVGLEAQNAALEKGNSLIQARTAGLIASKRAELDSAFGSEDAIIRRQAAAELENYTEAVIRNSAAQAANEDLVEAATKSVSGSGGAASDAAKQLDKLKSKIQQIEFEADPIAKYRHEIAELDKLLDEGLSKGAYDHAVEKLNEELADAIPMVSDVSDAFGEWVARGFKDFDDFVGSIWRSFQGLLADMISAAARNRILFSMGIGGSAAGTAASAAGAAAGGGGSGGGILGGLMGGGGGMLGSFGSAAAGTVGTGLLGGLGNALGVGASSFSPFAIGTNAAMAGGGLLSTLGAALPAIGLVAGAISLFVGRTKELDRGIRVTVDGMDALVDQFRRTETSRLFGLIKSRDTDYSRASAAVADPIIAMVGQIQTGVLGMSESLGIGAQAFEDFSTQVKVSTKGLSEEEAQKAIEEAFRGMADEMAELALEGRGVIRIGEGASEALERLSNALAATNRVFDTLGHEMYEASVSGADIASSLVDLFGGLDSFNSATTRFFEVAYTEAERMEIATRQAHEALAEFNIALPASRAAYRQLVESIDHGTRRGQELYAVLVGMADTMDRILPQAQTFTDAIAGLFSQTNSAIQIMINEAQGAAREAGQAAQDWFRAADTLRDFITDLTRASDTALTPDQQMRALSRDYRGLFSSARGGDVDAAREFPQAADAFLDAARGQASTALEFRRIESRVRAQANLLAGISELEGAGRTVAEDLALQQVEVLNELNDYMQSTDNLKPEDLAGFENRLGALQSAIEHVEMINYDFLKKRLDVTVDLLPEADIPADVAKLISTAANGIDSTIEFAVRAADLTPDLRWLALTGASEHIAGLQFIIEKDLPNDLRKLATTEVADLTRDVRFAVGQDLPQDLKRIALIQNANVSRTVTAALGEADPLAIRTALAESDTVQRVFDAVVQTGKLTPQQRSLLTAISGAQPGILQLRGGFQFDPSSAFSSWYETTTREAIANPMAQLRSSLDSLRDAMEKQAQVDAINSYVSSLPTTGDGTYVATGSQIHDDLAGMLGLNPNQNTYDLASKISGMSGLDNLENLAVYDGATRSKLLEHIDNPALQVNPEAYLRRRQDVAASEQYGDDPQGHWEDYGRDKMLSGVTGWFHPDMFDWSTIDIPGFAAGGMHTGGLRMVGERGPELEATGPARYYSASQTRAMMGGDPQVARDQLAEMKAMREELRQLLMEIEDHTYKQHRSMQRWTANGLAVRNPDDGTKLEVSTS